MDISEKIKEARLKLERMSDEEFLEVVGKAFVGIKEIGEECPDCHKLTLFIGKGGGVTCSDKKCGYWFCY